MVSKPFQRPFSLATRLTFFISLATIAAFFAFAWIMIHSVKVHFAEQDINDLKEISATLERVLNHPTTQARRLMTLEDIVSGYSNVLISLAYSHGKTVYHSPGAPDIREFTRDAIPDKDAQGGEVYLLSGPTIMTPGHGHGHMEHSNWRMINLPVGPLVDGKPIYTLYIALSIDFHLHYINDLMNKLIMTASVISILIVFIVLLAVHKGHAPIPASAVKSRISPRRSLMFALTRRPCPLSWTVVLSFTRRSSVLRTSLPASPISQRISLTKFARRLPISSRKRKSPSASRAARRNWKMCSTLISKSLMRMAKMVSDMLFLAQADNNQLIPEKKMLNLADEVGSFPIFSRR